MTNTKNKNVDAFFLVYNQGIHVEMIQELHQTFEGLINSVRSKIVNLLFESSNADLVRKSIELKEADLTKDFEWEFAEGAFEIYHDSEELHAWVRVDGETKEWCVTKLAIIDGKIKEA